MNKMVVSLDIDGIPTIGYEIRTQSAALDHLPELRRHAAEDAAACGLDLADGTYEIGIYRHSVECGGLCPDVLGLALGCTYVELPLIG